MNIRNLLFRGSPLVAMLGSCFYTAYVNEDPPVVHIARNLAWNDFITRIKFLPAQDSLDKELAVNQKFLKAHETEVTLRVYDLEAFKAIDRARARLQKADGDLVPLRNELSYREEQAKLGR